MYVHVKKDVNTALGFIGVLVSGNLQVWFELALKATDSLILPLPLSHLKLGDNYMSCCFGGLLRR